MFVEDYNPQPIKASIVKAEGEYQLKIESVEYGKFTNEKTQSEKRYFKVNCIINAEGFPKVAVFLTEGPSFDGEATAFFDTFGIPRNNWQYETWKGHTGRMFIALKQKGEYLNMIPRYLLDDAGYVRKAQSFSAQPTESFGGGNDDQLGDIPF